MITPLVVSTMLFIVYACIIYIFDSICKYVLIHKYGIKDGMIVSMCQCMLLGASCTLTVG